MTVVVMAICGTAAWMSLHRPTSTFVDRSRVDLVTWSLLSGVTSALIGWRLGTGFVGAIAACLSTGLIVLTEIDLHTRRLPREISYPLFMVVMSLVAVSAWSEGDSRRFVQTSIGVVIATGVLWILHLLSRGQLGDGDVRLAPALGTVASIGGVSAVWTSLLVAFVGAGAFVAILLALGRASRRTAIPFGPFLALGTIVTALVAGA